MALTNQQLAEKLEEVADGYLTFVAQVRAFFTTPADGGPDNDGEFLISDVALTEKYPGLRKLKELMFKGDNAATDISFSFPGGLFGANELIALHPHAGVDTSIDVAQSVGACDAGLATAAVISLTKNGAAWGTVTFTPGSTTPTITIASPGLAHGDIIRVFAPPAHIPSFTNPTFNLAGSL